MHMTRDAIRGGCGAAATGTAAAYPRPGLPTVVPRAGRSGQCCWPAWRQPLAAHFLKLASSPGCWVRHLVSCWSHRATAAAGLPEAEKIRVPGGMVALEATPGGIEFSRQMDDPAVSSAYSCLA